MSNTHYYNQYYFNSNLLCQRYITGSITLEEYASSINNLIDQEMLSVGVLFDKEKMKADLYEYENAQQGLAKFEKERVQKNKLEEEKRVQEEERQRALNPDEKLYEAREKYYQTQIPKLIQEYRKEANKYRSTHNTYQWVIILGSATTTSITSITVFSGLSLISTELKIGAAFCSLLVTVAASLTAYFKHRERSINAQKAADDIEYEYDAIKLGTHSYLDEPRNKAMSLFVDRVMRRIKEQKEQQLILEQTPEAKKLQPGT